MNDARRSVSRERDLVLPPNTFAFILNKQKGEVEVYVGPHKSNLDDNTDQPVIFDYNSKGFKNVQLHEAIQKNMVAPEGWYLVLKNPATENKHPSVGTGAKVDLEVGKKINIPGPIDFPLFPGQMCKVVQGHHLRSNQYLIARVYDPEAANKAISSIPAGATGDEEDGERPTSCTMGQLMIIKGTEQSFYIPPTGIEVVQYKDEHGRKQYVQNAVTLERLEYCVLLDENGKKEYVKGPDVVFPKPTQQFITKNDKRKFRAINLNEISGIYIKVTTEYEENGKTYNPGDELFITGGETAIYYPREEHAIIKYDGNEVHYATAVPAGEGRYVMNRLDGKIDLEVGPKMLLPDPRQFVMVRRILSPSVVDTWFPGNEAAKVYNDQLSNARKDSDSGEDFLSETMYRTMTRGPQAKSLMSRGFETLGAPSPRERSARGFAGDEISKSSEYTKPRTIVIDQKFEGAVRVSIWRGYAVLIESKSGDAANRVEVGPKTILLQYDEDLVNMSLSTGTPKSAKRPLVTPYLRHLNNTVTDTIRAQTKDLVDVSVTLSYKVDFTNDPEKWFNVENYVQHLVDRLRSMIRKMAKTKNIETFNNDHIDLLRDLILGTAPELKEGDDPGLHVRPGYTFPENGMKITDVEVLGILIGDDELQFQLQNAQTESITQTLEVAKKKRELDATKLKEKYAREEAEEKKQTEMKLKDIEIAKEKKAAELAEEKAKTKVHEEKVKLDLTKELQESLNEVNAEEMKRIELKNDQKVKHNKIMSEITVQEAKDVADAEIKKFGAITPQLIAAMKAQGDKNLLAELSRNFNVKSMIGAKSVVEAASLIIRGTALDGQIDFEGMMGEDKTGTEE